MKKAPQSRKCSSCTITISLFIYVSKLSAIHSNRPQFIQFADDKNLGVVLGFFPLSAPGPAITWEGLVSFISKKDLRFVLPFPWDGPHPIGSPQHWPVRTVNWCSRLGCCPPSPAMVLNNKESIRSQVLAYILAFIISMIYFFILNCNMTKITRKSSTVYSASPSINHSSWIPYYMPRNKKSNYGRFPRAEVQTQNIKL